MDPTPALARPTCTGCRRIFGLYSALTTHQRSCKKTNKRASDALTKFQEIIESRKRRRLGDGDHVDQAVVELVPKTVQSGVLGLRDVRQAWLSSTREPHDAYLLFKVSPTYDMDETSNQENFQGAQVIEPVSV